MKKIGLEQVMEIGVARIHPDPQNKNVHNKENLEKLTVSMKAHGQLNPILVRPFGNQQYRIITGEGRWQAAKMLGWQKIFARIVQIFEEEDITSLRLAENAVRTWDLIAESQEIAHLHSQNLTVEAIANRLALAPRTIKERVAVGRIPAEILEKIRNGMIMIRGKKESWPYSYIRFLLPLRVEKDDQADYQEIETAVDLINSSKIAPDDIKSYVAERRLQLQEQQQQALIEAEVTKKITEINEKQELAYQQRLTQTIAKFDQEKKTKIEQLEQKLKTAIEESRKIREEKAKFTAQYPQEITKIRQELEENFQKQMRANEQSFHEQITRFQLEINRLKKEQQQIIEKNVTEIKKEYNAKIVAVQAKAGKDSEQAVRKLEIEMQKKISERENEVKKQFQQSLSEKNSEIQKTIAENQRIKAELEILQSQLDKHPEEIQRMEQEYQQTIAKKNEEILASEELLEELSQQIEIIKAEKTLEAQKQAAEIAKIETEKIKAQLLTEYEAKEQVLKNYYTEQEKKLRTKVEMTVSDATAHFVQTASALQLSLFTLKGLLELIPKSELFQIMTAMKGLGEKFVQTFPEFEDQLKKLMELEEYDEIPQLLLLTIPKEVQ